MGLIAQTIKNFETSLQKAMGESPVLKTRVATRRGTVIVWFEDLVVLDVHDPNYGEGPTFNDAFHALIESLTNGDSTYSYWTNGGIENRFRWNGKEFERC